MLPEEYEPPLGAIATRDCPEPGCEAERGARHEPWCTPDHTKPRQPRVHPTTVWFGEDDWA